MSDIERRMAEWRKNVWGAGPCPDASRENFRLTDAEREAVDRARIAFRDMDHNAMTMQQIEDYESLCGLLERLA